MKKLLTITLVLMLVFTSICVISTSAAEADDIVHSLLPAENEANGKVTATDCKITYNDDGSVTFTVTGAAPRVVVTFAEDTTIYAGDSFNVREGAYFVFDYGSADGATLADSTQAHYTRKDKEASGKVADLWLSSMMTMTAYQKANGDGYGIWSLGDYLVTEKGDAGIFDDNMHRFTSVEFNITGAVDSSVTVYRFYIGTADAVEGLGAVRPEAPAPEESVPEESVPENENTFEVPEGAYSIGTVPFNTGIIAGSTTIVTDPATIHNYNVKWTSCALLRPTDEDGVFDVVAVQWLNGDDTFLFTDAQTGDVVLSVHGDETVEGSQANRDALNKLVAGDKVVFLGYDFENTTVEENAVVYFDVAVEVPEDESVTDESEPENESEPADESAPADDSSVPATSDTDVSEDKADDKGGNTGLIIGIVAAVVVVAVVVVVVIVIKKKK